MALCGLLLSLAIILSFIDTLIPMPVPIPGIKLGLANLAIIYAIYRLGIPDSIIISIARVILSGLLFSGMSGIMYSLTGAVFSLVVMILLKKLSDYHIITVSVCGSIAHITGQLLIAGAIVGMGVITYYGPPLLIASFITGIIIGTLAYTVIKTVRVELK